MRCVLRNRFIFLAALAMGLGAAAFAAGGKKTKGTGLLTAGNKACGYWIRYPQGSTLDHPSDCALKITLPLAGYPKWINEVSMTLYTAPKGTEDFGEKPDPSASPAGYLKAGGLKFTKTVFLDAGMSHRWITLFYEAQGKKHRYQLKGFLNSVVPEVMDEHPKDWDPQRSAEKIFDGMVLNFRPLE